MSSSDTFKAQEFLEREGPALLKSILKGRRGATYAEMRFETVFVRGARVENGLIQRSVEHHGAAFGLSVCCCEDGAIEGWGYYGFILGNLADRRASLCATIRKAADEALRRAKSNARKRKELARAYPTYAKALLNLPEVARPRERAKVEAIFEQDPRTVEMKAIQELGITASAALCGLGNTIAFNAVNVQTEHRDELFVNSEGSVVRQQFAFSQGDCYVVAVGTQGVQEIFDTIGQQRGLECLCNGRRDCPMPNDDLVSFALVLGKEAVELANAPELKAPGKEVTVVTDPHFNALLVHEIVGHPSEADRALKAEAAYAGRSWFLRSLAQQAVGQAVASPLVSVCSDPAVDAYGYYRYDHEGTPGQPVFHIERGIFRDFLHSRTTAAILGTKPNGSVRASEAWYVPLIRMSNTFFTAGDRDPQGIIGEVDRGFYVCGHMIPSIAESRENFRISARRVYEIERGQLGRLYRSGSVLADTKRFLLGVDAVGNDLRLFAVPNCGKGQPMQVKRMSNGGPTLRSRAFLVGSSR